MKEGAPHKLEGIVLKQKFADVVMLVLSLLPRAIGTGQYALQRSILEKLSNLLSD